MFDHWKWLEATRQRQAASKRDGLRRGSVDPMRSRSDGLASLLDQGPVLLLGLRTREGDGAVDEVLGGREQHLDATVAFCDEGLSPRSD